MQESTSGEKEVENPEALQHELVRWKKYTNFRRDNQYLTT